MALTKINFEIEVEDTFQNGRKLDLTALFQLMNNVAENEYNRQFDANMLQRRFGMSMPGATPNVTTITAEDVVEGTEAETEAETDETATPRRRRGNGLGGFANQLESKLMLPR